MQNENQKLNPLTCELQVGDVVEVIGSEDAEIIKIDGKIYPFQLKTETGWIMSRKRDELRFISRNGKTIEELSEKKFFANVYDNGNGRFLSHDYDSFEEAYENREDISTYIETVEIVRHEKPAPKIDFGKAGLILTDGECIIVTTGHIENDYFSAEHVLYYPGTTNSPHNKSEPWRDITAEAEPIIEQLKTLMK